MSRSPGLNRCSACAVIAVALLMSFASSTANAAETERDVASRSLIIAVGKDAPPVVKAAAQSILAAANQQPLLQVMANKHEVKIVDAEALLSGPVADRAFNHLIIVGLPDDSLVAKVWQREAAIEPGGIYVFGFGHLKGDIGYIESDRNPFLHSEAIARAPFETEMVTISGTTPAGVALAAKAFVQRGVVNGVIAASGAWSRPTTSLLDRDPISPDVQLPNVPQQMGGAPLIAVTQASGDEYGNTLADAGVAPSAIWRFKYAVKGAWDAPGMESAIADYNAGLHRRAFADMVWAGTFASPEAATEAAKKIAAAASLTPAGEGKWKGHGKAGAGVPMTLWLHGPTVYMSDLQ